MFTAKLDSIKTHQFKFIILAILLILPVLLMALNMQPVLRYHALADLNQQYWRWLTGHWVHLSWGHLWMNLAALLILIISFYENLTVKGWLLLCFSLSILTSLAFILLAPELRWYVGLSGILHGLFVFLILHDHKLGHLYKILFITGISLKLIWEQIYGAMPGSAELAGGNVVVDAHLYGGISGLLGYLINYVWLKSVESRPQ